MLTENSPSLVHPPLGTLIDDDSLELIEVLGVGGYGVVYRAEDTCSSSPKSYAVKCLVHRHNPQSFRQRQIHIREIALHQLASAHPNVVTLHRVIEDYNYTYIIMDYAPDHDLFSQILHSCRYLGDDYIIKHVFLQLLDAVEYCHSLGIYHRDLKPENVLCFDGGLRVAITDFGLATTDKVSEEFRTGSVYHMSPECQGGEFAPGGTYSPMFNDIWSLGIILLNLATGRNPWKSASPSDPTFQAYLRDPLGFLPTVLPISQEANIILTRMLEVDWRDRMTLPEIRQAIEELDTFYSEGVIFEGSMARCPWEAGMEIDSDSSATKYEPAKSMAADLKSHWSQESGTSDIVFAKHSPATTDSAWMEYPEYEPATYAANPEEQEDNMYDDCGDHLFTRPRTPPSLHSPCVSESASSYPVTPSSFDTTFGGRAVMPQRKALVIDTGCARHHPRYYNGSDSLGTLSSTSSSSIMETAVEDPAEWNSSFFLGNVSQPKVSPITIPQSVTLGDSDNADDKEMASPTVWNCSVMEPPEIPSMYSSTHTSFTDTHLSFDHRSTAPSPDTMTWSEFGMTSASASVMGMDQYRPGLSPFALESQPSFSLYMSNTNAPSQRPVFTSVSTPSSPIKKSFETKLKGAFFTPLRFFPRPSSWQASRSRSPSPLSTSTPIPAPKAAQTRISQTQEPVATFTIRQAAAPVATDHYAHITHTHAEVSRTTGGFEILATTVPAAKSGAALVSPVFATAPNSASAAVAAASATQEHRRHLRHRHWFLPSKLFASAEAAS